MFKISDFTIPCSIIKAACRSRKVPFVDLPVQFNDSTDASMGLIDGVIHVGQPEKFGLASYRLVYIYLINFHIITGIEAFDNDEQKQNSLLLISNFIRQICYRPEVFKESLLTHPVALRLYQFAPVWVLMKDLICPMYDVELKNYQVITYGSPYLDIASCVDMNKNDVVIEGQKEPFIFLNAEVEYKPFQLAALLIAAIKCHGMNESSVIRDIVDSELREKLIGFARLMFRDDNEVNDFICLLLIQSGIDNCAEFIISHTKNNNKVAGDSGIIKTAQSVGMGGDAILSTWWFLGLVEKMLETQRGPDWSTYKRLHPWFEKLWNKIEKERQKRGREGLTYEALLRIRSGENNPKHVKIIEKTLASDRVW
jgi:hypothetical protein